MLLMSSACFLTVMYENAWQGCDAIKEASAVSDRRKDSRSLLGFATSLRWMGRGNWKIYAHHVCDHAFDKKKGVNVSVV